MPKVVSRFSGLCLLLVLAQCVWAEEVSVQPDVCAIVLPKDADHIKTFAADELAKHLGLITGKRPPVGVEAPKNASYIFYVGIAPKGAAKDLANEQACYKVTKNATWLWGKDDIRTSDKTPMKTALILKRNRTGTLFAVYFFLENQFHIRWVEPGDPGIVCPKTKTLTLQTGEFSWTPKLLQRHLRPGSWSWRTVHKINADLPKAMRYTPEECEKKNDDEMLWLRRQRMGSSISLNYGHAFTAYWEKYGKEHPDWFAMQEDGVRRPESKLQPDRVKLCVTNPELRTHIVQAWLAGSPSADSTLNTCENDSCGFCRCEKCRALDVPRKGEEFGEHLTDRYVWFANQLLAEARKSVPGARAVMYGYGFYRTPPRREKVADGLVIGFIPGLTEKNLEDLYRDWQKTGAKEIFLRPNDMWTDKGIPMGFEKKMFDNFQIGLKYGIIGTDYDRIRFWGASGLGNYALARAHIYPERRFEDWQKEYCSAYGPAGGQVEKYLQYWRDNVWEKRTANTLRGDNRPIVDYYSEKDFDTTDAVLREGLEMNLSDAQRARLEQLLLYNQHGRLTIRAMAARKKNNTSAAGAFAPARELLQFRMKHRDDFNHCWPGQFAREKQHGDITGIYLLMQMQGYMPLSKLPVYWNFRTDPKNAGLAEQWQRVTVFKPADGWDRIRTDRPWEKQTKIDPALQKQLSNYNGVGWYATELKIGKELAGKKLYLIFGAVDESCIVYLDGKEILNRPYRKLDDWKIPFVVPLGDRLKGGSTHLLTVRVEDKAGLGGIWKPVWLVCEE